MTVAENIARFNKLENRALVEAIVLNAAVEHITTYEKMSETLLIPVDELKVIFEELRSMQMVFSYFNDSAGEDFLGIGRIGDAYSKLRLKSFPKNITWDNISADDLLSLTFLEGMSKITYKKVLSLDPKTVKEIQEQIVEKYKKIKSYEEQLFSKALTLPQGSEIESSFLNIATRFHGEFVLNLKNDEPKRVKVETKPNYASIEDAINNKFDRAGVFLKLPSEQVFYVRTHDGRGIIDTKRESALGFPINIIDNGRTYSLNIPLASSHTFRQTVAYQQASLEKLKDVVYMISVALKKHDPQVFDFYSYRATLEDIEPLIKKDKS